MANEYLIQGETLTSVADTIRQYTTAVVGHNTHTIAPEFILDGYDGPGYMVDNQGNMYYGGELTGVIIKFWETIENAPQIGTNNYIFEEYRHFGLVPNNKGQIVPMLSTGGNDYEGNDCYYYLGMVPYRGEFLDKWIKVETYGDNPYNWESENKKYAYTNHITQLIDPDAAEAPMSPTAFPDKITEVYNAGVAATSTYENANEEVY